MFSHTHKTTIAFTPAVPYNIFTVLVPYFVLTSLKDKSDFFPLLSFHGYDQILISQTLFFKFFYNSIYFNTISSNILCVEEYNSFSANSIFLLITVLRTLEFVFPFHFIILSFQMYFIPQCFISLFICMHVFTKILL